MDFILRLVAILLNIVGNLLHPIHLIFEWFTKTRKVTPIDDKLLLIPAIKLAEKIRRQEIKSEEIVRAYIDRIKSVNEIVNAVVEDRFEDAIQDAKHADELCATMEPEELSRFPLLGVPFTVKESCGLKGFSHAVGSVRRKCVKAPADGEVVTNLKTAGAIPLLISANPEFCTSWECKNLLIGRCNNPYNDKRSSGGSSGGEGALIGAGASIFGVGSDIAGSIRVPALFNGIFGHKATGGLLSSVGHFPISTDPLFKYYQQTGPMTRYARDLPMLLQIMAGDKANKLELDKPVNIRNIKIYNMDIEGDALIGSVPCLDTQRAISEALVYFKTRGFYVKKIKLSHIQETLEMSLSTLLEMTDIPNILIHPDNPKIIDNLVLELAKHLFGVQKYSFESLIFMVLKETGGFMTPESRKQHSLKLDSFKRKLNDLLGTDGVLFYPTMHCQAFRHNTSFTNMPGIMYTMLFNVLGFPATHVPMGLTSEGLPVGFQVVAAPYQDRLCLAIASELETAFGGWVPPS